ncbi:MAG: radical SAM protein [Myxococcaceae bacterium]
MTPRRVLVVNPPVSVARDFIDYPYFANLGAVQLAAVLRARGHEVTLVDAFSLPGSTLSALPDDRVLLGAPVAEVLAACRGTFDFAFVVLTPFHRPPRRDEVLSQVLAGVHTSQRWLVDAYQSGQHYVDAEPDDLFRAYPEAQGWVKYEAEVSVPRVVESDAPLPRFVRGEQPKLDELPLPAWDLVDLRAYDAFRARVVEKLGRGGWAFPIDGRTLPLITSRGCPYSCVHCSSNPDRVPGTPKVQRRLSAARLRELMTALVKTHGATRLEVLDELLNVDEAHFDGFLALVHELNTKFDVPNGLRADGLEPRHFDAMAGRVTTVSVSAESGVQRIVDQVVKKKLDLARITQAAREAKRAGVPLLVHFIIGLPGETAQDVNATLGWAMELWDEYGAWPAVQFSTPLPGTQLAKGRELPAVDDWGPAFQHRPSQPGAAVSPEELVRFKWTFDQRLQASSGPKKVILNLTYVCNNHCTFCAVGTRTQIHGHPERQREHLERHRAQGVTMLDIDGGEPTLHPELIPLVRYARHLGYRKVNVTTNGRLLVYEDFAKRLVQSGLTTLLFSVHGPDAKTHAQQVGVAEAFEQTTAGIRNALRFKPTRDVELGMNITLTRSNTELLPQVTQLAWDLGLRWLNVQFLTPFGRATRGHAPDTEQAAAVTKQVIDAWKDRMKFQVINLPFCFMRGYESYLMGDLLKLERHMVFVNNEEVNLSRYLSERRVRKPVCETCPNAVFCGGFYELDSVPEPPWVFDEDDAAGVKLPVVG